MSRVGDLMTLMAIIETKANENPAIKTATAFSQMSQVISGDESYEDFIAKYMRAIDSAIDEVMAAPKIPSESKQVMVMRLGSLRKLVSVGFSKSTIGEAFHLVSMHGNLENLTLIYSSVVAGGVQPLLNRETAVDLRARLVDVLGSIRHADIDAFIRQSIIFHVERIIEILSQFEMYGSLDAEIRLKSINSDINVLRSTGQIDEQLELDVVQPILSIVSKVYPYVKLVKDVVITSGAAKTLLE